MISLSSSFRRRRVRECLNLRNAKVVGKEDQAKDEGEAVQQLHRPGGANPGDEEGQGVRIKMC